VVRKITVEEGDTLGGDTLAELVARYAPCRLRVYGVQGRDLGGRWYHEAPGGALVAASAPSAASAADGMTQFLTFLDLTADLWPHAPKLLHVLDAVLDRVHDAKMRADERALARRLAGPPANDNAETTHHEQEQEQAQQAAR
jgi:hypothetical protein